MKVKVLLSALVVLLVLSSCGKPPEENPVSDSIQSSSSQNIVLTSSETVEGLVFQETVFENFMRQELNLNPTEAITQEICDEVHTIEFEKKDISSSVEIENLADLAHFPNIETLIFQNCKNLKIETIPSGIGLTSMTLINCNVQNLEVLESLPTLSTLFINNFDKEIDLKGINKCPSLQSISLINCGLKEVDRIADITGLEYLDISTTSVWGTSIEDYSSLSSLTNLKYLDMNWSGNNAYNQFHTKDASFINSLTNLEYLNIRETGIEGYDLSALSKLKTLIISECDGNEILEQLTKSGAISQLEILFFDSHNLTQDGILMLSNATSLKDLTIYLPHEINYEGFENLTNLNNLVIHVAELSPDLGGRLEKLILLESLKLDCRISLENVGFLSNLVTLKKLYLSETPHDFSISALKNLKKLEELDLHGGIPTSPRKIDIKDIGELTSLKTLNIYGIEFKSSAPLDDLDIVVTEEY